MDLRSSSHHPGPRTQAQHSTYGTGKASNFVWVQHAVGEGKAVNILQEPQKVSGDVWHHCDQILTYTSESILGAGRGHGKNQKMLTSLLNHRK